MLKTTGIALFAALTLAGAASAQESRGALRVDRDGDRRVSLAEMQARQMDRFARLDADRNGQLTREERKAGREAMRGERQAMRSDKRAGRQAAMFARRDKDGDGQLSAVEAPKRLGERFAQLDANRDGRLNPAELQAARRGGRGDGDRVRDASRTRPDTNRDGVITRAEFEAQVRARFARVDLNRDGFLTREERRSHRQARRG